MKKIVAIVATVLFIIVGDVEIINNIALMTWWQLTLIFAGGIAILIFLLHMTAEP